MKFKTKRAAWILLILQIPDNICCQPINSLLGLFKDDSSLHWSEVSASSLVGVDKDSNVVEDGCYGGQPEESAACIHLGIRKVLPVAKVRAASRCNFLCDFLNNSPNLCLSWCDVGDFPHSHRLCHGCWLHGKPWIADDPPERRQV